MATTCSDKQNAKLSASALPLFVLSSFPCAQQQHRYAHGINVVDAFVCSEVTLNRRACSFSSLERAEVVGTTVACFYAAQNKSTKKTTHTHTIKGKNTC